VKTAKCWLMISFGESDRVEYYWRCVYGHLDVQGHDAADTTRGCLRGLLTFCDATPIIQRITVMSGDKEMAGDFIRADHGGFVDDPDGRAVLENDYGMFSATPEYQGDCHA